MNAPSQQDLLDLMQECVDNRGTSWFYEWNLIDLHDAIHRHYDINESERKWFHDVSDIHGPGAA